MVIAISPSSAEMLSADTKMKLATTITGDIAPKSVRASGTGYVSAHNMMYRHSVTIYDAKEISLIKTIPDRVDLTKLGFSGYSGTHRGAPVEGAYSPDGEHLYVTNYAMYGKGFNREGTDICRPSNNYDRSFLYRIDTTSWEIDAAYKVGVVPKVVEVSPDNNYVLVTKMIKTVRTGNAARSLDISSDGSALYVVNYTSDTISKVRASDLKVLQKINVCNEPIGVTYEPVNKRVWVACYGGAI